MLFGICNYMWERWNFLIEIIGYAINLYNFILQVYRGYDWGGIKMQKRIRLCFQAA